MADILCSHHSVPLAVKMCLVKRYPGSIEHVWCALLPKEIPFRNDGLFSATTHTVYSQRRQKRAGTAETLGSRSCSPYTSHAHWIWSGQCPRISEKGFHLYEVQNNHISWTRSPKYPLPSSKQNWQTCIHRHFPGAPRKYTKAKLMFTKMQLGTFWWSNPPVTLSLAFLRCHCLVNPAHQLATHGAGLGEQRWGSHCQRPWGARHGTIPPWGAMEAQPVPRCWGCPSGTMSAWGSHPNEGSLGAQG